MMPQNGDDGSSPGPQCHQITGPDTGRYPFHEPVCCQFKRAIGKNEARAPNAASAAEASGRVSSRRHDGQPATKQGNNDGSVAGWTALMTPAATKESHNQANFFSARARSANVSAASA